MDPTNRECNKLKPFDRADRKPLDVTEGDGECKNLLAFDVQVNIHHLGGELVIGILVRTVGTAQVKQLRHVTIAMVWIEPITAL